MSADVGGIIGERFDGLLIKILDVADNGTSFFGRLVNGGTARFTLAEGNNLERGEVILIGANNSWYPAPGAVWPDDSSVGVVRKILDDGIALEGGAGIRMLKGAPAITVEVGNTVEFNEFDGVTRVVSESPLRYRDSGVDDDLNEYLLPLDEGSLTFDAFGGYEDVIARARELIETQLGRREELEAIGAQPVKGVLFTGPPGTGKTHLARIISQVSGANFYLVSGPAIVSKYVGDSEETLRRIFEVAEKDERAIIFFDEIDSIAARRSDDSSGESKRVVAQLLTLLDGFKASSNIIVIAATNRIEDIDEALLRPGRFDWEIEFSLPSVEDRLKILQVRERHLATAGTLPLEEIAELTEGWSGAALTAIWTEAALLAARDKRCAIVDEDLAVGFERVKARPTRARTEAQHVD
jgi:transitional endoplasmic reticulum ATPase